MSCHSKQLQRFYKTGAKKAGFSFNAATNIAL
jgi:hypothetical protein